MFDSLSRMSDPALLPDLITYLEQRYREAMLLALGDTDEARAETERTLVAAKPFTVFCRRHMNNNRPTQSFMVDNNVGIQFADATECVVATAAAETVADSMLPDTSIAVTTGKTTRLA